MPADWTFWTDFLRSHNQLHYVALNFQTGNKNSNEGHKVIDQVQKIQDSIGRPLSLMLIGGAQFIPYAARQLGRFVLIDSKPFANAHRRRVFQADGDKQRWEGTWSLEGQPIDHILQGNVEKYARWIAARGATPNQSFN